MSMLNNNEVNLLVKIKYNFWNYCCYMEPFVIDRKEQLKPIADALQKAYEEGLKVCIATPPRTGKSTMMNLFISWVLLLDNKNSILRASYSADLSEELNESARKYLETDSFKNLNIINPQNMNIKTNTKKKIRLEDSHRANIMASSVGGSITGFGANIIIGDDLYKDHNEALSETVNEKTITWFFSAFKSRLDSEKQTQIFIGTRWRIGELVDVLENSNYFDIVIKIPALTEDNRSFNENIIKTEVLLENKRIMHPSIFNSMYQQQPMMSLDSILKIQELRFFKEEDLEDVLSGSVFLQRIMIVDIADQGSDRTACVVADVYNNEVVIQDLMTNRSNLTILKPIILQMARYYKPILKIENNKEAFFAREIIHQLNKENIIASGFFTKQNKVSKIVLNAYKVKDFIFIRTNDEEYNEFIQRMVKYDLSKKNQHDDEIDVMSMLAKEVDKIRSRYDSI